MHEVFRSTVGAAVLERRMLVQESHLSVLVFCCAENKKNFNDALDVMGQVEYVDCLRPVLAFR